uniref:Transmembrane protein n=1 Tax=Arabidopsis thaliana TaxID=3702 RepID=Q0WLY5_ARATH|nr:hypothetical protein [Arabidopsis thaliana]
MIVGLNLLFDTLLSGKFWNWFPHASNVFLSIVSAVSINGYSNRIESYRPFQLLAVVVVVVGFISCSTEARL